MYFNRKISKVNIVLVLGIPSKFYIQCIKVVCWVVSSNMIGVTLPM